MALVESPGTVEIELVVSILNSELRVESLDDGSPRRRLVVEYDIDVDSDDRLVGRELAERISVHAVDQHDAAVRPRPQPVVERTANVTCESGVTDRRAVFTLHRTALDVNQDWWSSGPGGEVRPIAEWTDHLAADISLSVSGRLVAQAMTSTVSGSWGALGEALE